MSESLKVVIDTELHWIYNYLTTNNCIPIENGYSSGKAGILEFYINYARLFNIDDAYGKLSELAQSFLETLADKRTFHDTMSISGGLGGAIYILDSLKVNPIFDFSYDNVPYYNALTTWFSKQLQLDNFDYLHGALGILRLVHISDLEDKQQRLTKMIMEIRSRLIDDENGIRFLNHYYYREAHEKNLINLSLSHGIISLGLILIDITNELTILKEEVRVIINGICRYIFNAVEVGKKINLPEFRFLPAGTTSDLGTAYPGQGRLAWCFGDLGLLLLLNRYYKLSGYYSPLIDQIDEAMLLRKDMAVTLIEDAHFCHGSSGVLTIFSSLYNETGKDIYNQLKKYWQKETLDYLKTKDLNVIVHSPGYESSFLYGLSGIGMSLMSSVYENELKVHQWKRIFLL